MSTSSGFACSSRVTTRGSRAIPQIGHDPGSLRTISGCMGQVYSASSRRPDVDDGRGVRLDGPRELRRVGSEVLQALCAAEVVRRAPVNVTSHGILGGNPHPAHGIHHLGTRRCLPPQTTMPAALVSFLWPPEARSEALFALGDGLAPGLGHGREPYLPVYCCGLLSNFRLHPAEQKT